MTIVQPSPEFDRAPPGKETRIQAARRQQLIDAVLSVIAEHGLSQLTLAKVAGRAGLTAAMVNFHFKSKSELLLATLRQLAAEFEARANAAVAAAPDDPWQRLAALIDVNFSPELAEPRKVAVWYAFWGETQARGDYQAACGETDATYDRLAIGLFEEAARRSGRELDSEALAQGLVGLIDSQWQSLLADPESFDPAAARDLCRRYLKSVLPGLDQAARAPKPQTEERVDPSLHWSLPAWSYSNQELFEAECARLHLPNWQLVCHLSQIPEAGDYRTFDFLGKRAFVLRGGDGAVRAFHNLCRHRAHAVVTEESGRCAEAIRCPYHGWSYALDGRLKAMAAERSFPAVDKERFGLLPIEVEVFLGLVFIRFEGSGPSVAERMAPYAEELARYRIEEMQPIGTKWDRRTEVDWKNVWDNYLEGYHFPIGHPGLYGLMQRHYERESRPAERVARLWHAFKDAPGGGWSNRAYRKLVPRYDHLCEELATSWRYYLLFPGVALDVYPEQLDFFQVVPEGPGRCRIQGYNFALPDSRRETRIARRLNWRINGQVQREDEALIASVQKGLESGVYQRGLLSEKEELLRSFQGWITEALPVIDLDQPPPKRELGAVNDELLSRRLAAE